MEDFISYGQMLLPMFYHLADVIAFFIAVVVGMTLHYMFSLIMAGVIAKWQNGTATFLCFEDYITNNAFFLSLPYTLINFYHPYFKFHFMVAFLCISISIQSETLWREYVHFSLNFIIVFLYFSCFAGYFLVYLYS